MNKNSKKILFLTEFSLLLAIEAIFCFTPLGSIPIGPIVATLAMVPVIITGVLLGTGAGTLMGFIAGVFSLIVWTFTPPNPITAFAFTPFYSLGSIHGNFWSIVICIVPRALVGTAAGVFFRLFQKLFQFVLKNNNKLSSVLTPVPYILSGFFSSAINTVLVLGGIFLFFAPQFASALKITVAGVSGILLATALTNGIAEAIVSAILAPAVCIPLKKSLNRQL